MRGRVESIDARVSRHSGRRYRAITVRGADGERRWYNALPEDPLHDLRGGEMVEFELVGDQMHRLRRLDRRRVAAQLVVDAWVIEGVRPDAHRAAQARLRREWPTLYHAIEGLVAASRE